MSIDQDLPQDYCPHCLNGGTISSVSQHLPSSGWSVYDPVSHPSTSLDRASLCGDAYGDTAHMLGGMYMPTSTAPIVRTYSEGSVIRLSAELDTNHNGYFEYFLCDLDACGVADIANTCFEQGHCHKLLRVPSPACENAANDEDMHTRCGPVDEKYPGRWYVPCRKGGHVGVHIVGGEDNDDMMYRLPSGVTCEHCVLQWYWATANSCAPRGLVDYMQRMGNPFGTTCQGDGGAVGTYMANMAPCGGDKVPEEFWSCADIRITAGNGGASEGDQGAVPKPNEQLDQSENENQGQGQGSPLPSPTAVVVNDGTPMPSPSNDVAEEEEQVCMLKNETCDGTHPCCGLGRLCMYRADEGKFMCSSMTDFKEQRKWNHRRVIRLIK